MDGWNDMFSEVGGSHCYAHLRGIRVSDSFPPTPAAEQGLIALRLHFCDEGRRGFTAHGRETRGTRWTGRATVVAGPVDVSRRYRGRDSIASADKTDDRPDSPIVRRADQVLPRLYRPSTRPSPLPRQLL